MNIELGKHLTFTILFSVYSQIFSIQMLIPRLKVNASILNTSWIEQCMIHLADNTLNDTLCIVIDKIDIVHDTNDAQCAWNYPQTNN